MSNLKLYFASGIGTQKGLPTLDTIDSRISLMVGDKKYSKSISDTQYRDYQSTFEYMFNRYCLYSALDKAFDGKFNGFEKYGMLSILASIKGFLYRTFPIEENIEVESDILGDLRKIFELTISFDTVLEFLDITEGLGNYEDDDVSESEKNEVKWREKGKQFKMNEGKFNLIVEKLESYD